MTTETGVNLVIAAGVIAPMAAFGLMAFYRLPAASDEERLSQFLYAGGEAETRDFTRSTVAYMLQVYVTFYFIYWGYNYGFSNVFYLISWGLGIYLFVKKAPTLIAATIESETLANILAKHRRDIRTVFGLMAAIYFAGMVYLETHYAAEFLDQAVVSGVAPDFTWWLFFGFLLLFVVLYSSWGGVRKVFLTDRHQLSVAYLAFAVLFAYIIDKTYAVNGSDGLLLSLVTLSIYGYLLVALGPKGESITSQLLLGASFVVLLLVTINGLLGLPEFSWPTIAGPFKQVMEPGGAVTLLGFVVLNVLWQFCDASNYQRVRSIQESVDSREEAIKVIKEEFYPIIYLSPVTWGLGIVLGMGIQASNVSVRGYETEYGAFVSSMVVDVTSGGSVFALLAIGALTVAVSSIMLSTADSCVAAFYQTGLRDVLDVDDWKWPVVASLGVGLLLFCLGVGLAVRQYEQRYILTVVASVNGQILVAAPAIIMVVQGYFERWTVLCSIIVGTVAVWWSTFAPPTILLQDEQIYSNILLVFPILAGTVAAVVPIGISLACGVPERTAGGSV